MQRDLLLLFAFALILGLTGRLLMTATASDAGHDVHPHATALKNPDGSWKYTNDLAHETSPYLLQHAHNPVDWHPWGPEAFALAQEQQKPIFLSVGYSTCYWCHVMERQVFEDPEIAAKMNELFINIKVDREERPDVDDIYMTATQFMTQSGGWPMSVFLTPPAPHDLAPDAAHAAGYGLKPFWCGTYIPPKPMYGRPSFPQVLRALHHAWQTRRDEVLQQAAHVADGVTQTLSARDQSGPLDAEPITQAANALLRSYDPEDGGFGGAPKFPQPTNLAFVLAVYRNNPIDDIADVLHHTLDRMARGGMYDQVGGGFHRYSVDEKWLVPHFEKMLYDNAQLLSIYAHALTLEREQNGADTDRDVQYARILRETAEYVLLEMTDETGAFWSAQDAEVNAREGENYLWTAEQIGAAIDDKQHAALATKLYGVDGGTNFKDPHAPDATPTNVLYLPKPIADLAKELELTRDDLLETRVRINAQLKAVRDKRDQPGTDDKVLVAWNGLMIKGLAEAGAVLDEPRYIDAAARAADAVVAKMSDPAGDGVGLFRTMRGGQAKVPAFLEDYSHFVAGLVALHRAGAGEGRYLEWAKRYTDAAAERFARDGGGYYDTLADQSDLFIRVRSTWDGAVPTGNSVMAHNLLDLYEITQDPACLAAAVRDIRGVAEPLRERGTGMIHMQHALMRALEHDAPALAAAPKADAVSAKREPQPQSDQPVTVQAAWRGPDTLQITVTIAEGFHINATDPDDPNLIATTLTLAGPGQVDAVWPEAKPQTFPYADRPLMIYQGTFLIDATLAGLTDASVLELRVQPCNDQACLTPRTIAVTIPPR